MARRSICQGGMEDMASWWKGVAGKEKVMGRLLFRSARGQQPMVKPHEIHDRAE